LALHGHELGTSITSLQANLEWVVSWTKGEFRGSTALAAEKDRGVSRILRGIATQGRRPPRAECAVLMNDEIIGRVTSGNYSPILEHGIALAFVHPTTEVGDIVTIDVRGTPLSGQIVNLPFIQKK
jgi:aminomethyltransferase